MKYLPFNVKAFREQHNLKQAHLAHIFGVSVVQVYRLEQKGLAPTVWVWAFKGLTDALQKWDAPV
jgi:DNA-binding transcriptional regulator YiaG